MAFSDDFNRSDSSTLGANWTDQVAGMRIVSNAAKGSDSPGNALTFWNAGSFANDQYSEGTLGNTSLMTRTFIGVRLSGSSSQNGMTLVLDAFNSRLDLWKWVTGTATNLGSFVASGVTFSAADVYRVSVTGNVYTCTKGGVQQGSTITDASFASGSAGIGGQDSGDIIDSWAGGDVSAGAIPQTSMRMLLGVG